MTEGEKTYLRITSYANYSSMNGIEKEWIVKLFSHYKEVKNFVIEMCEQSLFTKFRN